MSKETELLTEMRDLLRVLAEPAIEKRDEKLRASLRSVVTNSPKKAAAVMLMDGSRAQSAIARECGMNSGVLSRLVQSLSNASLIASDEKYPRLVISIFSNLFDIQDGQHE